MNSFLNLTRTLSSNDIVPDNNHRSPVFHHAGTAAASSASNTGFAGVAAALVAIARMRYLAKKFVPSVAWKLKPRPRSRSL
jgi:hypothetical protein